MTEEQKLKKKETKQRYFKKTYDEAPMIECACGCGTMIKSKDKYARNVKFVNGHNNRKYDDPTQYKREWNHRNRKSRYEYKQKYLKDFRVELIQRTGGKCNKCGIEYNGTNAPIFDFHHTDPSTKEQLLGLNNLNRVAKEKLRKESDKCVLLCANCHRLTHGSEY